MMIWSSKTGLIRSAMSLAIIILLLGTAVLSMIVYNYTHGEKLAQRANLHLRIAGRASEALSYLTSIDNILLQDSLPSFNRIRDLSTYHDLFDDRVNAVITLSDTIQNNPNHVFVTTLKKQWELLHENMDGLESLSTDKTKLIQQRKTPLQLTLRQLERQNDIAYDEITKSLNEQQREGTRNIIALLLLAIFIGGMFVAWTKQRMQNAVIAQYAAEKALQEHRDQLEKTVHNRTLELETAVKELEAFSYSVSHDLRSPLRAIDGFSHAIYEEYHQQLDKNCLDYLSRIRFNAQRMGTLIDDLLKLSRVSRIDLQQSTIDLSLLARNVLSQVQTNNPERNVAIQIADKLTARGDPQLLEILLTNLLDNALKYTSKVANARIEFGAIQQNDEEKVFFIRDNGIGFDTTYSDKLFGAFQRLHGNEYPGSGIGLATVKRIIQRHGGKVWAESEVNQGTTFYFTLNNSS